jgi:cell division protein FtsI/penicillin-binding protein 2
MSYAGLAAQGVKPSELGKIVRTAYTEQVKEEEERKARETNIIIHRAPESKSNSVRERMTYDQQFFDELCCNVLDIDVEPKDVARLGKPEHGKNRPLRITLGTKEEATKIHERTRNLKHADRQYKNIVITHDLTPEQRSELKALAEEAKQKNLEAQDGPWEFKVRSRGPTWKPTIKRLL